MTHTTSPASKKRSAFLLLTLYCLFAIPNLLQAATINVSSLAALQTAINNANPGDVIILANGVYTAGADITINKQGTASQPITIQAASILGAEIKGTGGFSLISPAKYIIIKGFKFTHSASQATMASGTSFCRFTRNLFQTPGSGEYLQINGNDHEIDYNTFQNKTDPGKFITVRGTGSQISQRHWIHHNYFFHQEPGGGNGNETIQFGLSGYSLSNSNSILEYNLFEECDGENEGISVKASQVTLRYNTFRNNPAQFTLRHGNRCTVNGNYFINTPGLRIFGDDHKIFSNHFENCNPAINMGNGDGEVADGAPLTSHDRPDRVLVAYNTLVNNPSNYSMGGRTNGLGATNITFANNIIQGGGAAATIDGPYPGAIWSSNMIYQTNGDGDMPASGYTTANPLLARDATGTFHLQSGSPAIDAGTGSYPSVVSDMDGQARTSPLDKGADEVSSATVTARILTPAMVGPNAGDDPQPGCVPVAASADDGNVPANVLDGNLATRWSANGDGQWIQFCLSTQQTVTGVKIAFYNGNTRTSTFDVLIGNDGVNWSTMGAGIVSSGTTLNLESFNFSLTPGKYVRIVGHGNSVNLWNSYTEVIVMTTTNSQNYTLFPLHDAYVRDGINAAITHGITDSTFLITKVAPAGQLNNNREAYLQFDLSAVAGITGSITRVTYNAFGKVDGTTVPSVPVSLFPVTNTTWTESALTWNNKPAAGSTALGTATVPNTANTLITYDITSHVLAELAASRTKMSFVMRSDVAHDPRVFFGSDESASGRPFIQVETSTSGNAQQPAPQHLALERPAETRVTFHHYPNPFKVSSTITFRLEKAGQTNLSVFDMTGKRVAVLLNGYLPAGNHQTIFTPGTRSAGIYILKLEHNGKTVIGRVMKN